MPWRRPELPVMVPSCQQSRVPWDPSYNPKLIRMVGHSHIRRQIRLLTARVIAAERAAGMNSDDTAKAEHLMERHVRDRREAVEGKAPDHLVFAFQLGPAHPVARCRRLPRRADVECVEVSPVHRLSVWRSGRSRSANTARNLGDTARMDAIWR